MSKKISMELGLDVEETEDTLQHVTDCIDGIEASCEEVERFLSPMKNKS